MLSRFNLCVLALAAAAGSSASSAHALVSIETSRRTITAYASGQSDTRSSPDLGAVTLEASAQSPEWDTSAAVTHHSVLMPTEMSGTVSLAQRGLDEIYAPSERYIAWVSIDNVMTFNVDAPTPYAMELRTISSTWDIPPIYGLIIASGAWNYPDDGGITHYVDGVSPPHSGSIASQGVLAPGRYTAFFRFTTAFFGPNTYDLSAAALSYSLTIPAPASAPLLAFAGAIAARRRR